MFKKFVPDEVDLFCVFLITRGWETGQPFQPSLPAFLERKSTVCHILKSTVFSVHFKYQVEFGLPMFVINIEWIVDSTSDLAKARKYQVLVFFNCKMMICVEAQTMQTQDTQSSPIARTKYLL
jgi:hypothetical protein